MNRSGSTAKMQSQSRACSCSCCSSLIAASPSSASRTASLQSSNSPIPSTRGAGASNADMSSCKIQHFQYKSNIFSTKSKNVCTKSKHFNKQSTFLTRVGWNILLYIDMIEGGGDAFGRARSLYRTPPNHTRTIPDNTRKSARKCQKCAWKWAFKTHRRHARGRTS